jgi:hypothetical protein
VRFTPITGPLTTRARVFADLLPEAVACLRTAAHLWGLKALPMGVKEFNWPVDLALPVPIEIPGCTVREAVYAGADRTVCRGVQVTSMARTALDCARILPRLDAIIIVDQFLRRGVELSELRQRAAGYPDLQWTLSLADRNAGSPRESRLRVTFTLAWLPRPTTQIKVPLTDPTPTTTSSTSAPGLVPGPAPGLVSAPVSSLVPGAASGAVPGAASVPAPKIASESSHSPGRRPPDSGLPTRSPYAGEGRCEAQTAYLDLGWPEYRVAVEYDGQEHHSSPSDRARDAVRRARLAELGWHVITVRRDVVPARTGDLIAHVADTLIARGWDPGPVRTAKILAHIRAARRRR